MTETTEFYQPLVRWRGKIEDTRTFLPAQLEEARLDPPLCPVCKKVGSVDLSSGRPLFRHSANHEAETPLREEIRLLLGRWLLRALPGSQVRMHLPWRGGFLDLGVVRSDGARLAVRILSEEPRQGELLSLREDLRRERTALLFVLDPSRLDERAWRPGARLTSVSFRRAESDLLRIGDPLLYLLPHRRRLLLLEAPQAALPLLREKRNLGTCQGAVHHYRLSELRLREGRWFVDRSFDEELPQPELPRGMLERLENLR